MYGHLKKHEKAHLAHILALEINGYLKRIYKTMHRTAPLKMPHFSEKDISFIHAYGFTKTYEFRLNKKELVQRGDIGKVLTVNIGMKDPLFRKQRALFIASEIYVYHAFANHPNAKYFNSIRCQNQYLDIFKKIFGRMNSHELRDQAIRYVIEEIDEHDLAHMTGKGWHVSISKVDKHRHFVSDLLGSSEKTFKKIVKRQNQTIDYSMMLKEEHLVKKEIEDIRFLIDYLENVLETHPHAKLKSHLRSLDNYSKTLHKIYDNFHKWYIADKQEHKMLKKQLFGPEKVKSLLAAESEAATIDMNKVYLLFQHFELEKTRILKDIRRIQQ